MDNYDKVNDLFRLMGKITDLLKDYGNLRDLFDDMPNIYLADQEDLLCIN